MPFSRFIPLIGDHAFQCLQQSSVLLLGVGGVGSWAAEAIVRSGIGEIAMVDFDTVSTSNINRQLHAMQSTVGQAKTAIMAQRLKDINPNCKITAVQEHLTPDIVRNLLCSRTWNMVIDAIDERAPKVAALVCCVQNAIPVVSSMGAGNRLTSDGIRIADISQTAGCPLARSIRHDLKAQGITTGITAVFSPRPAQTRLHPSGSTLEIAECNRQQKNPITPTAIGSAVFVTAAFGLKCAEVAINAIIRSTVQSDQQE